MFSKYFSSKNLILDIENGDQFDFDRYGNAYVNNVKQTASISNSEYSLKLLGNGLTQLTVSNLGLIIQWYAQKTRNFANFYINKDSGDEIRGYCGSTDNNSTHNLDPTLTEAVYGSISQVLSPQCDGKLHPNSRWGYKFNEVDLSSTKIQTSTQLISGFKYCKGSPGYRRRRSTDDEDDSCNGDDPLEVCSGILDTLSDCKKALSENELNAFLGSCHFDMCLDDRIGCAFLP